MGAEIKLRLFSPSELKLSNDQACQVLKFFFPNIPFYPPFFPSSLTPADCCFAQALLVEAIDRSYQMKQAENIFNSFFMKIPDSWSSVQDMVKDFAKEATKDWFEHAKDHDLLHPQIYENVRKQMFANFRSIWEERWNPESRGLLTY